MLPRIVHQAFICRKCIAEILLCSWPLIDNLLQILCAAYPYQVASDEATSAPIYLGDDVDLVFLPPMKVKSSSSSATSTAFGTGTA